MNKKIMLLALAAVSAAVLAVPSMASALTPLHLNPTPEVKTEGVHGGTSVLSTTSGLSVTCDTVTTKGSSVTFNAGGTTGTMQLLFGGDCRSAGFTCTSSGQTSGEITTTVLPFDLATVGTTSPGEPGVLVTPAAEEHFASFSCVGLNFVVKGNGVIGTFEELSCGGETATAKINFATSGAGVQADKKLVGTSTEYTLKSGSANAAMSATGEVTLKEKSKLECT